MKLLPIEDKDLLTKIHFENIFGSVQEIPINAEVSELIIHHKSCQARVCLKGGQVLSWTPNNQEEVFWLSKKSPYSTTSAIRGGVPICWPWFGNYKDAPSHGFARNKQWQIDSLDVTKQSVKIVLTLKGSHISKYWPYNFLCKQTLEFSSVFKQEFYIENRDSIDFHFSNAFHSYFNISSPTNIRIPDLNLASFDNKLSQIKGCSPQLIVNCEGPLDNIYHHNSTATLFDKGKRRAIEIKKSNSSQWVLWNPGENTASQMIDIHQGGENEFVCLEAANTNMVSVASGESIVLSQEIKVYKL